jgi:hypothetical protein
VKVKAIPGKNEVEGVVRLQYGRQATMLVRHIVNLIQQQVKPLLEAEEISHG